MLSVRKVTHFLGRFDCFRGHNLLASIDRASAGRRPAQRIFPLFFSMNKADLVNSVAADLSDFDIKRADVSRVVETTIDTIINSVVNGDKVSILGFGSFESRERSARQGLNPKTGEPIQIPAKRVPAFTPGKMFKDRVQEGAEAN